MSDLKWIITIVALQQLAFYALCQVYNFPYWR